MDDEGIIGDGIGPLVSLTWASSLLLLGGEKVAREGHVRIMAMRFDGVSEGIVYYAMVRFRRADNKLLYF